MPWAWLLLSPDRTYRTIYRTTPDVSDVLPDVLSDVFTGRIGRITGRITGRIGRITGRTGRIGRFNAQDRPIFIGRRPDVSDDDRTYRTYYRTYDRTYYRTYYRTTPDDDRTTPDDTGRPDDQGSGPLTPPDDGMESTMEAEGRALEEEDDILVPSLGV